MGINQYNYGILLTQKITAGNVPCCDSVFSLFLLILHFIIFHSDNFQNIEIKDILDSVRAEVTKLKNDGVNIIIANGHAAIKVDIEVAKLDGIDVVVGGDSETFMYTGRQQQQ